MSGNESAIVDMAKAKSSRREAEVISAIRSMIADGDAITFYSVAKRTGASRSFLYTNQTIRAMIEDARSDTSGKYASSKVIIDGLKSEIRRLKAENARLAQLDAARLDAEVVELRRQVNDLKKQLRSAYSYNDIFSPFNQDR